MGFGRGSVCDFCDCFWVVAEKRESRGGKAGEVEKRESKRGIQGQRSVFHHAAIACRCWWMMRAQIGGGLIVRRECISSRGVGVSAVNPNALFFM